jgi:LacI family transcriptional regulator
LRHPTQDFFSSLLVAVSDQVRIVVFDDVKYASLVTPPLTTIHQPCDQLGASALQAMEQQRIATPDMPARDVFLDFQLVVRESCGSAQRI